jgi:chromosome segregation ATPase
LGYLGYVISKLNKQNHEISQELSGILEENKEMNKIIMNEDFMSDKSSNNLKSNLNLLLLSYDSLEESNTLVVDSINQQREKITSLLDKVNQLNSKTKKDWRKIYKLKKEAETLRGIMKGYIHTIDSLNTLNINLSNSLNEKTNTLNKVSSQNKQFKQENKALQEKVKMGAVLQSNNVNVTALRIRKSGSQSETTRASKANMIKSCFTLIENKLAKAGDKTIYLRFLEENGEVFSNQTIKTINYQKETIEMSSQRTINYQNENTDVCVFYEINSELVPGNYSVEIFNKGYLIGKSSLVLR